MNAWVYIRTEPGLYTVGFFDPDKKFHTDSDHCDREDAANRVAFLNGFLSEDFEHFKLDMARLENRLTELQTGLSNMAEQFSSFREHYNLL